MSAGPSWRSRVGLIAGAALFAAAAAFPAGGAEAEPARRMAGVALLMAAWWISEAIPLGATALVPVFALPVLGILPARQVCARYGDPLILLFLGGFLMARALARWRIDRRLALGIVALMGERPSRILFGLMAATALLSMWVSNSATAAMMMPVGLALVGHAASLVSARSPEADVSPGRFRFGTAVMLGIAYAASIGGVGTLIGSPPNLVFAGIVEEQTGVPVTFVRWMAVGLPLMLVMLPAAWLWLVRGAFPPELDRLPGGRRIVREQLAALPPMGAAGRRTIAVILAAALAWVTRPLWEEALVGAGQLHDGAIAAAAAVALFLLPDGQGGRLLDRRVFGELPWEVLLLFGGGLALAEGFKASGLDQRIGGTAVALAGIPLPLFVVLVGAVVMLLTEFTSNTATTAMVLPLLLAASGPLGTEPVRLMLPAALAASMAFMMPAATPPNAIVFGTGYVTIPQMVRAGVVTNTIALAVIALLTESLSPVLF
ncbi:MAG: SLC13/DASS family transporter [Acidobacteria bacterium]|nr:MAG: SLC13/DASS family transporter [Acidobacteriota bacterium]